MIWQSKCSGSLKPFEAQRGMSQFIQWKCFTHTLILTLQPQRSLGLERFLRSESIHPYRAAPAKRQFRSILFSGLCDAHGALLTPTCSLSLMLPLKKKLRKNRKRKTKKTVRIKHLTIQLLRGKGWKNVESEFPYGSVFCGLSSLCLLRINVLIFILSFST